ncbi:MAG: amino acid permease [Ignavibacteria bacterium]|nr:amino acid permease [Ignavibacteria bacterium]MBI3766618.1 amino acid permease [Ignavibacteriales bacterium]
MELSTSRPRVLGWLRSAAILDGDWGTSIAYVLGIAFFHSGYASGWHLMMMLVFTTLIALNYITICRLYPGGGGVYSSVSHRSRTLAVIGALLLSADYVVTASLSVLDACHYLALQNPEIWAIAIILCIGVLNWYGPRHAGSVAIVISSATLVALLTLVVVSFPAATRHVSLEPAPGGITTNWGFFVAIILSISGIEAISNMTGVMKDPARNSRRAILSVLAKISIATIVLGLAMLAIPHLSPTEHKEEMIRYLGEFYIGNWFGPIIGIVLGFLLISAGNTALNDLISIQFLMSVDGELPSSLRRLNKYGVPVVPLLVATSIPIIVLLLVHDVITLSDLYAIGVVGAIMINVGSTGTDKALTLPVWTRMFMVFSSVILFLVEATIAVEKTKALVFALSVLAVGLTARELARRQRLVVLTPAPVAISPEVSLPRPEVAAFTTKMLVAVRGGGEKLLRQACEDAGLRKAFLFVLNIKQVAVSGLLPEKVPAESFANNEWMEKICREYNIPFRVFSILSPEVGYTIAENAATLGIDRLMLGASQRSLVEQALRGDVIRTVSELLPEDISLVIYRA